MENGTIHKRFDLPIKNGGLRVRKPLLATSYHGKSPLNHGVYTKGCLKPPLNHH